MTGLVKNTFIIIGAMVASLLLFYLAFGPVGRTLMWDGIAPVFNNEWMKATWQEGSTNTEILTNIFNKAEDISAQ